MQEIEVFAEVGCPFTHFGLNALRDRRREAGLDEHVVIRVRAWPLEWVNGKPLDGSHVAEGITDIRSRIKTPLFAGFRADAFPVTSVPAMALTASADMVDPCLGEAVAYRLRELVFERGEDVASPEVLRSVAVEFGAGMPDESEHEMLVRREYENGKERGVLGSPHFFVGGRDWYCPALVITRADGRRHVEIATDRFEDFLSVCFAPAGK